MFAYNHSLFYCLSRLQKFFFFFLFQYSGEYTRRREQHPVIQWFWQCVENMSGYTALYPSSFILAYSLTQTINFFFMNNINYYDKRGASASVAVRDRLSSRSCPRLQSPQIIRGQQPEVQHT